jgi:uncharacterized protein YndB with AHSA1/START domain
MLFQATPLRCSFVLSNQKIQKMNNEQIIYPAKFQPANSPVFVRNEIDIAATPERVWMWLTYASTWHEWYFNASTVEFTTPGIDRLVAGAQFNWKTFGATLQTQVKEFVPNKRLAWEAHGMGIQAYHAWLILPTSTGCKVITEETQHGWLCRLGKLLMPNRMFKYHQIWLEGLKKQAE